MELRKGPITRSWVLAGDEEPIVPNTSPCPYCQDGTASTSPILSVPMQGNPVGVRVFPHPHPLYRVEGPAERRADGIYDRMRNVGAHEVIVEGPEHNRALANAPEPEIEAMLRCWALRIADLKNDVRFKYITVFRNCGELSGQRIR